MSVEKQKWYNDDILDKKRKIYFEKYSWLEFIFIII